MASIVTRNGKRCTAVPKVANAQLATSPATSTSSSSTSTSTSSSSFSSSTSISTSALTTSSSSSTSTSTSATTDLAASQVAAPIASPESPSATTTSTPSPAATPIANVGAAPASTTLESTTTDETSTSETRTIGSTTPASSGQSNDTAQTSIRETVTGSTTITTSPSDPSGDSNASTTLAGVAASVPTGASQSTSAPVESQTNRAGISSSEATVTGNAITTQQTIAIAAGVIGGVVAISLIAFLVWLWRKRKMQQRRSTLLTPLSPDATFRGDEKGPYPISRMSVGPTPFSEKPWAVAGTMYKKLRGRVNKIVARSSSPSPSVNLDRGNSQYGPPGIMLSRDNSDTGAVIEEAPTTKSRFVDWWGRLAEDGNFNWRLRDESKANPAANDSFAIPPAAKAKIGSQPDYLTLLSMDDKQFEREAAGRGQTSANGNQRRSVSVGGEQHFLGGLDLNFDMADPFSDVNVISSNTAKATPLIVSVANDPFSDANAIAAPPTPATNGGLTTYVQNMRRSRGRSVNEDISRQPSTAGTYYRESNVSIDTIGTRRTKFRSDPFDLDRPDLLQSANSSTPALAGGFSRSSRSTKSISGLPNTPRQAHVRTESFTSKYSSGVSSMGWSDPGPDVGPAAARSTPTPDSALGKRDSDPRRRSGGSQGSVGKAL
ncbi:hypothetical protein GGR53DRAFT_357631 [Hypoxylon sp. FL1150]|nr:hypothetical protein GGR53DRAFT_357631 [Hypoxylon sp. FL1150]